MHAPCSGSIFIMEIFYDGWGGSTQTDIEIGMKPLIRSVICKTENLHLETHQPILLGENAYSRKASRCKGILPVLQMKYQFKMRMTTTQQWRKITRRWRQNLRKKNRNCFISTSRDSWYSLLLVYCWIHSNGNGIRGSDGFVSIVRMGQMDLIIRARLTHMYQNPPLKIRTNVLLSTMPRHFNVSSF